MPQPQAIETAGAPELISPRLFRLLGLAVVVLALALREEFVLFGRVDMPIRGDIAQYVAYAWNLVQHGVFSMSPPGSEAVVPDAFRGPGYPAFLAVFMGLSPRDAQWYLWALQAQAVLGAASVALCLALARRCLPALPSLLAGLMLALWPHHVAASGALLSEVVFGFLLLLALWLSVRAQSANSPAGAAWAGLGWACAYLVNPIALVLPPVLAWAGWRGRMRAATLLLAPCLIAALAWSARSQSLPASPEAGRATINFVQGSWPVMHTAWAFRLRDPVAAQIIEQIDGETRLLHEDPERGLRAIGARMGQDPAFYLRWYVWDKPWLLWDWDIRVGAGDVYFLEVRDSPLETNRLLHAVKEGLHRANRAIFVLAVLGGLWLAWPWRPGRQFAGTALFLSFACLTLVHVLFQAEPRYAIPYRGLEMILFAAAVAAVAGNLPAWLGRTRRTPRD